MDEKAFCARPVKMWSQLYEGARVTCRIKGEYVSDAKVSSQTPSTRSRGHLRWWCIHQNVTQGFFGTRMFGYGLTYFLYTGDGTVDQACHHENVGNLDILEPVFPFNKEGV